MGCPQAARPEHSEGDGGSRQGDGRGLDGHPPDCSTQVHLGPCVGIGSRDRRGPVRRAGARREPDGDPRRDAERAGHQGEGVGEGLTIAGPRVGQEEPHGRLPRRGRRLWRRRVAKAARAEPVHQALHDLMGVRRSVGNLSSEGRGPPGAWAAPPTPAPPAAGRPDSLTHPRRPAMTGRPPAGSQTPCSAVRGPSDGTARPTRRPGGTLGTPRRYRSAPGPAGRRRTRSSPGRPGGTGCPMRETTGKDRPASRLERWPG